ncbi:MAG: DNA-binding protein [Candidatus Aenigmatarchaeota archaeon]
MEEAEVRKREEIEKVKKELLRKFLTKEAIERLGRVRLVKPELAERVEAYLIESYYSGKLKGIIDDNKLKEILQIASENLKKKYKIIW